MFRVHNRGKRERVCTVYEERGGRKNMDDVMRREEIKEYRKR